jgi:hypothetical protein
MRLLSMALLTMMFVGCVNQKEEQIPLPEKEELIRIFIDLHMAEIPVSRVPLSMRDSVGYLIRGRIARDHGMSEEELQEIVHAVQMDVELVTEIYDSVDVRLKRMQKTGNYVNE